jgi:hypothetical protein
MCLIVGCLFLLGPRAVVLVWWLADQVRWALTFPNPILPVLGFLFLPWTTIIYVLVFPLGSVERAAAVRTSAVPTLTLYREDLVHVPPGAPALRWSAADLDRVVLRRHRSVDRDVS